jgi:class 3 adenylate cyclase
VPTRDRKATRTGTLLLAAVSLRMRSGAEKPSPAVLVSTLKAFLDAVATAVEGSGGGVLQFVGNCSIAAWTAGAAGPSRDPIDLGRHLMTQVRASLPHAVGDAFRVCLGFAEGECVYREEGGRVVEATAHALLRVAQEFRPPADADGDTLLLDRPLAASRLPGGAGPDDGWIVVM